MFRRGTTDLFHAMLNPFSMQLLLDEFLRIGIDLKILLHPFQLLQPRHEIENIGDSSVQEGRNQLGDFSRKFGWGFQSQTDLAVITKVNRDASPSVRPAQPARGKLSLYQ